MTARAEDRLVLVVDDEVDLLEILTDRLRDAGYRVLTARDGLEALRCLRHVTPDCIVLDLKMPRLGGLDALPEVRRAAPDAHLVILTGSPNRPLGEMCRARGADDFLLKPFDARELLRRIARALGHEPEPRPPA